MAVLKVFEGCFRVFNRCFCMAYVHRVVNVRYAYIRLGVILGVVGMFFFVFKDIFHVCIGF